MPDFITLSCPSCGAKLEITNDLERFACSHCGVEQIVRRSGGIVSLAPVVDAINQVKGGVDKTAAELAIVRLTKEIDQLSVQFNVFAKQNPRPSVGAIPILMIIVGLAIIAISLISFFGTPAYDYNRQIPIGWIGLGAVLVFIGGIPILLYSRNKSFWENHTSVKLQTMNAEIARKMEERNKNYELVTH